MATTAPVAQKTFAIAPAGTHVARVYKFMNLGTRVQTYKGELKDYPDTLVRFTLELPNELNEFEVETDGVKEKVSKPFVIDREFTLSMGKKSNLRPFVEGIIGTPLTDQEAGAFDIEELIGMTCQVTVVHKEAANGNTYANIASVAPLMKGIEVPEAINKPVIQDVKKMTLDEINELPDFLKEKMEVSDEYKARFDQDEIERKKNLQAEIDARKPQGSDEITAEDVPW